MMWRRVASIEGEQAPGRQMPGRTVEEALLIILCQQALEGVGAGDGKVVRLAEIEVAEIAIDPADRQALRLAPGVIDHGRHGVQAGDFLAGAAERDGEPAGAAAEIENARTAFLCQIEEEPPVIVDAAVLGVITGAVVILAATHRRDGDVGLRTHTRTRCTSVTGFLPWLAWTARRRAMRAASLSGWSSPRSASGTAWTADRTASRSAASSSPLSASFSRPWTVTCGSPRRSPRRLMARLTTAEPFQMVRWRTRITSLSSGSSAVPSRPMRPTCTCSRISAPSGLSRTREPLPMASPCPTWHSSASFAWATRWRASPWTGIAIRGRTHWYIETSSSRAGWPETCTK